MSRVSPSRGELLATVCFTVWWIMGNFGDEKWLTSQQSGFGDTTMNSIHPFSWHLLGYKGIVHWFLTRSNVRKTRQILAKKTLCVVLFLVMYFTCVIILLCEYDSECRNYIIIQDFYTVFLHIALIWRSSADNVLTCTTQTVGKSGTQVKGTYNFDYAGKL